MKLLITAFIILITPVCLHSQDYVTGKSTGLQPYSSPQQAYILSDQQLEFSYPDISTISHIRWYSGKKEDYQVHFGLGIVLLDIGFSKILTRLNDHQPIKSRTTIGVTDNKRWFAEQQFSLGMTTEKSFQKEWFSSISLTTGFKKGGNKNDDVNRFYIAEDAGFSYVRKKTVFAVQFGISQMYFPDPNVITGGFQIGFSMGYLF